MPPYRPVEIRFWEKVALPNENGCMLWIASINKQTGYGNANARGICVPAHRISYELAHGEIPAGLQIDHLCRVRACVAPNHLEAVTSQVNNLRSTCYEKKRAKSHCKQGHERNDENTFLDSKGHRLCRACIRERYRRKVGDVCPKHGPKVPRKGGGRYCPPCLGEAYARRSKAA